MLGARYRKLLLRIVIGSGIVFLTNIFILSGPRKVKAQIGFECFIEGYVRDGHGANHSPADQDVRCSDDLNGDGRGDGVYTSPGFKPPGATVQGRIRKYNQITYWSTAQIQENGYFRFSNVECSEPAKNEYWEIKIVGLEGSGYAIDCPGDSHHHIGSFGYTGGIVGTAVDFYVGQCGDGTVNSNEQCENGDTQECVDGNGNPGSQACNAVTCSWEACIASAVCGNSIVESPEECDDGANGNDNDGCTDLCTFEYVPPDSVPGQLPYIKNSCTNLRTQIGTCGDGYLNNNETCDDGNLVDGDGCSSSCTEEFVAAQSTVNKLSPILNACTNLRTTIGLCGDGYLNNNETCDDGNLVDGDGCSSSCTEEFMPAEPVGNQLTYINNACTNLRFVPNYCGDGILHPTEECDYRNYTSVACITSGGYAGISGCTQSCTEECTTTQSCGDNIVQTPEDCDPPGSESTCTVELTYGNVTHTYTETIFCTAECKLPGCTTDLYCGDGQIDGTEECDDGNQIDNDGCTNECLFENMPSLPVSSELPYIKNSCTNLRFTGGSCGDGILHNTEQCDDGNLVDGDGCSSICEEEFVEPVIVGNELPDVKNSCTNLRFNMSAVEDCGDGIVQSSLGEECEGNDSQACSELNGYSGTQVCDPLTCLWEACEYESCGDGVRNGGEVCDGATRSCTDNNGYIGTEECTTNCTWGTCSSDLYCGDGVVNGDEECDGNTGNCGNSGTRSCLSNCTWGTCNEPTASPTSTPTSTPTKTPSPTLTPTATPTVTATPTPTASQIVQATPTPSATPMPELPDSGVSGPAIFGIGLGVILLIGAMLLAL